MTTRSHRRRGPRSIAPTPIPLPMSSTPALPNEAFPSRSANATLYATGAHCVRIRAGIARRILNEQQAAEEVARRAGLSVSEAGTAADFYRAVITITRAAGPSARELILNGSNPLLSPRTVIKLARRRPATVRDTVGKAAQGLNPSARPAPAATPPELVRWDHDLDRLGRAARLLTTPAASPGVRPVSRRSGRTVFDDSVAVRAGARAISMVLGPQVTMTQPSLLTEHALPDADAVAKARSLVEGVVRDLPLAAGANPPAPAARKALASATAAVLAVAERVIAATRPVAIPGDHTLVVEDRPDGPSEAGGTYIVVLRTDGHPGHRIGRLGTFRLPPGYLLYVGSAFGTRGVAERTGRHRDPSAPLRWNVDHLKTIGQPVELWWTNNDRLRPVECAWAMALASLPGYCCPAPRCGGNDCKRCPAHLFYLSDRPSVHDFAGALGQAVPGHGLVYRLRLDG